MNAHKLVLMVFIPINKSAAPAILHASHALAQLLIIVYLAEQDILYKIINAYVHLVTFKI